MTRGSLQAQCVCVGCSLHFYGWRTIVSNMIKGIKPCREPKPCYLHQVHVLSGGIRCYEVPYDETEDLPTWIDSGDYKKIINKTMNKSVIDLGKIIEAQQFNEKIKISGKDYYFTHMYFDSEEKTISIDFQDAALWEAKHTF